MINFIHHPSPNWGERLGTSPIDTLVLHYTGMQTAGDALQRLCDPHFEVSAHYMIDEEGIIYQLVDNEKRAWHAGRGYWRGRSDINSVSIGIELVNPGHEFGYRPFPHTQMQALLPLCQQLMAAFPILACNVIGHSDLAPLRKEDPGELFDWKFLAEHGVGLWPDVHFSPEDFYPLLLEETQIAHVQQRLAGFGYQIQETGIYDEETEAVIMAFKRHFCPSHLNNRWDGAAEKLLQALEGKSILPFQLPDV